jgi:7-cyano-7-deazaguanine reductase
MITGNGVPGFHPERRNKMGSFKEERSKSSDTATRYGKDIINNFNPDEDLVFWELQEKYTKNDYTVKMVHPEVSALCPVSGYPDYGKVTVKFVPSKKTVELKAFKLWINSFRDVNISHEDLANEIYNTLLAGLNPKKLYVKLEMNPRGNVTTVVVVGSMHFCTPNFKDTFMPIRTGVIPC